MVRKISTVLTNNELRLMEIIWEKGEASAKDIQKEMANDDIPAYTTISTFLKILEKKGYLNHRTDKRTFIYSPVVSRDEAIASDIGNVVKRFFDNSKKKLLLNLLQNESVTDDEIKKLEKLIESLPSEGDLNE